jgi:AraC-like DNA-binding protein
MLTWKDQLTSYTADQSFFSLAEIDLMGPEIATSSLETSLPSRFKLATDAPYWEGLVIPGIERGDSRIRVYASDPSPVLSRYIQSTWFMEWNISSEIELRSIVVPTPCIHLMGLFVPVVSRNPLWHAFLNVKTKGEIRFLKGHGQSFGVEFRPGGLYPFLKHIGEIGNWENGMLPLHASFSSAPASPNYPLDLNVLEQWIESFEAYFESLIPKIQANHLAEITRVFELYMNEDIKQVEEVLPIIAMSKRTLQRVFQTEVGLSPRDALRITRFHRSIKAMNIFNPECLANFALESGFFDQPHMINEFRKLVETNPSQFKKYW